MKKSLLSIGILIAVIGLIQCTGSANDDKNLSTSAEMQEAAVLAHHQQLGDSLVMIAQAEMLGKVAAAMAAGGPPAAVEFCNIHALEISKQMAERWNCSIRRTSELYRNGINKPDTNEANLLNWYKEQGDGALTSTVWRENSKIHYASPIRIKMPACLKCHGSSGKEIDDATMAVITENYPEDKATGYSEGDFRGMWHLTFDSN